MKLFRQKLNELYMAAKKFILRVVYGFYHENKVPPLKMIKEKLKDYPDCISLDTLRNGLR